MSVYPINRLPSSSLNVRAFSFVMRKGGEKAVEPKRRRCEVHVTGTNGYISMSRALKNTPLDPVFPFSGKF